MTISQNPLPDEGVKLDQVFEAMSHPARREVLLALRERDPRSATEFQSAHVTSGTQQGDLSLEELRHRHLPRLDENEFVNWDSSTNTITKGPRFEETRPLQDWCGRPSNDLPDR